MERTQMLQRMLNSYHNADAVLRFGMRCLLLAPVFIAGCVAMKIWERR